MPWWSDALLSQGQLLMPQCARKTRYWQCPNEAVSGLKKCDRCLGQNRAGGKRWRGRREEAGLCATPGCHARRLPRGNLCQACREAYREKYGRGTLTGAWSERTQSSERDAFEAGQRVVAEVGSHGE